METWSGQNRQTTGRIEQLEARVQGLMQTNIDPRLRAYLQDLTNRIARQKYQVDILEQELDRQCQLYQTAPVQNPVAWQAPQGNAMPQPPVPQQQIAFGTQTGQLQTVPAGEALREKRSAEFVIGAALSIVGGIFVLIALLLLGMYFMNGFLKGMILYAVCLGVMLISELVLYPRWHGMGETFSAIGMGGLYITTLVNYFSLGNFNAWVCMILSALITAGIIVLSRKRDAVSYRIIGIAACYLSLLMLPAVELGTLWLLTLTGVMFLINLMCILVPVRIHGEAIGITHLVLHTICSEVVFFRWADGGDFSYTDAAIWPVMVWVAAALLTEQLIFIAQVCKKSADGREIFHVGMCIAYGLVMPFYAVIAFWSAACWADAGTADFPLERLICTAGVLILCGGAMLVLRRRRQKWFPWYLGSLLMLAVHIEDVTVHPYEFVIALAAVLLAAELLTFTGDTLVAAGTAVLTTYTCIYTLFIHDQTRSLILLAVLIIGIPCINRFRTYFASVLTFTIALYTSYFMLSSLKLPVFVGILFLGMLVFNHVERWKDRGILIYNLLALPGQAVCFLLLLNPVYRNAYLTYFCMLIFGISTIVVCLQPKFHLGFGGKELTAAIFLTYMALIVKTNYDIINSILMMVIALVSVTVGFVSRKKSVRIYGLTLSLLVCLKIFLYDFLGAEMLQKTILFFVVGMIAIIISVIYMVLEKQMQKKEQSRANQNGSEICD